MAQYNGVPSSVNELQSFVPFLIWSHDLLFLLYGRSNAISCYVVNLADTHDVDAAGIRLHSLPARSMSIRASMEIKLVHLTV